jgi:hypothetical protein
MDSGSSSATRNPNTTIWLQATPASGSAGEVCGPCASLPPPGAGDLVAPQLDGPPEQIEAVLAALGEVREFREGRDIVASGRVQAIEIADGEATLTLRMGQGLCVDAHALAERAFDALRAALPDTDLYLRHDRPAGCAGKAASGG